MTNEPMTEQELREIEGLAAAATEGTWECRHGEVMQGKYYVCVAIDDDDAEYVAASRTAVPQMAAEIRRAWKLLEKAVALIDKLGCHNCQLTFGDEACAGCRVKAWEDFLSENGGIHE